MPGLDINYQEFKTGRTAAHIASMRGQTKCVGILAETDRVDWNKTDMAGLTPLYCAVHNGYSDVVEIIGKQPMDFSVKTKFGETLAQLAVRKGNVKCVETLAAEDCSWNVPDSDGDTPVHKALKTGKMEILEILLNSPRIDLNMKDGNGWSLVFIAIAMNGNLGKY